MYMYNAYMYDAWEGHEGYTHPHLTVETSISGNERGTRSCLLGMPYAYACLRHTLRMHIPSMDVSDQIVYKASALPSGMTYSTCTKCSIVVKNENVLAHYQMQPFSFAQVHMPHSPSVQSLPSE